MSENIVTFIISVCYDNSFIANIYIIVRCFDRDGDYPDGIALLFVFVEPLDKTEINLYNE